MTFLRDVETLRSGQDWNAELLKLIDRRTSSSCSGRALAAVARRAQGMAARAQPEAAAGASSVRSTGSSRCRHPPELAAIQFAYEPELDD